MCSVVLDSPRLLLRRLELSDANAVFKYRSDPATQECQLWAPRSLHEVEEFITKRIAFSPNISGTWFQFAICLRASGEVIGDCGVRFPDDDSEQVEIGVTLSPSHQGSGFATEAMAAVIRYVFKTLHKHRVFASVDPGNLASIKLLERLGMRKEAHHRESLWFKGRWADDLVYALLAREWHERKQ